MKKREPRNELGGLALSFPKPYKPQFPEEGSYWDIGPSKTHSRFYEVYAGPWVEWAKAQRKAQQEAHGWDMWILGAWLRPYEQQARLEAAYRQLKEECGVT